MSDEPKTTREAIVQSNVVAGTHPDPLPPPSPVPEARARPTAADPAKILLFTANAVRHGDRLRLEEELKAIDRGLRRSRLRERYQPLNSLAASFSDLVNDLDDHSPTFVHVSGHGDEMGNLILKDGHDGQMPVSPALLAQLLATLRQRPTLVTFANCHSALLAKAASEHAAYSIGFAGELADEAASLFSATLYERLAAHDRLDVSRAFQQALLVCRARGYASVTQGRLYEHPELADGERRPAPRSSRDESPSPERPSAPKAARSMKVSINANRVGSVMNADSMQVTIEGGRASAKPTRPLADDE